MSASQSPRSTRDTAGLGLAFTAVSRPNPVVIGWRWRYEMMSAGGLTGGLAALSRTAGTAGLIGAAAVAAVLTALIGVSPRARRATATRAWCVITPHRIRTGCAQAWVHTRAGKIPVVLLTRAQPFGERVWVWCRAGTAPCDLESARRQLAAACWARDVQVARSPRFAHLAAIDVVRRAERLARAQGEPLRAVPTAPLPAWPQDGAESWPRPTPADEGGRSDAA